MSKGKNKGSFLSKIRQKPKEKIDPELQALLDAVVEDPEDMRARLKLADGYLKREDRLRALDQYLTVAENYAGKGFYPKAVAVYKQALAIDPDMIEVYLKLAGQYQKLGLMGEVVAQYTKAAAIHEKAGRKKEAIDIFRSLIDLSPENPVGRLKLGQRYLKEGFTNEAIAEFLKAARVFEKQGNMDDVRRLYESILDKGIEDMRVVHPLLEIYKAAGEHELIVQRLATLQSDVAGSATVLELLAGSNAALGRKEPALRAYEKLVALYEQSRRPDKVHDFCIDILRIDPTHGPSLANVAAWREKHEAQERERARRAEEERARKAEAEAEIDIEMEGEEDLEIDLLAGEEEPAAAAEGLEVDEGRVDLSVPDAVEEDVWEVHDDEETPADDVDVFAEAPHTAGDDHIPMLDAVEHGYANRHGDVIPAPEPVETAEDEADVVFDEVVLQAPALPTEEVAEGIELEAADTDDVDLFAADADAESTGDVDLFAADESQAVEETISAEPEIELEPEPEPEPEPEIPAVDWATLTPVQAKDHLRSARVAFENAGKPEHFDNYLNDLAAKHASDITLVQAQHNRALETGDADARLAHLYDLVALAKKAGSDDYGRWLEVLVDTAPDDLEAAASLADHLHDANPDRAIVMHTSLARRASDREDWGEVEHRLGRVLEIHPDNPGALDDLLSLYRKTGDEEKSFATLLRLAPIAEQSGDAARSRNLLEEALCLRPDSQLASDALLGLYDRTKDEASATALLWKLGRDAEDESRLPEAEKYFNALLARDPDHAKSREHLKDIYILTDRPAEATGQLLTLAQIAGDARRFRDAEAALREALGIDPTSDSVRLALADMLECADRPADAANELAALADLWTDKAPDRAAEAFERALALAPALPALLRRHVEFLRRTGHADQALARLFQLADLATRQGQFDEAENAFQDALLLEPGNARAHLALKDLYVTSGRADQAVAQLLALAEIARKGGDDTAALAHLGEIVGLAPDNIRARRAILDLHNASGNVDAAVGEMVAIAGIEAATGHADEAASTLRKVLKLRPEDTEAYERLKTIYIESGDEKRALELLLNRAERMEKAGRLENALAAIDEVLVLIPGRVDALEARKALLLSLGDVDGAVSTLRLLAAVHRGAARNADAENVLREIVRYAPADMASREELAELYLSTDRAERAVAPYEELIDLAENDGDVAAIERFARAVLAIDPTRLRALEALADLYEHQGRTDDAAGIFEQLADLAAARGEQTAAREYLGRAALLIPDDPKPLTHLLAIAKAQNDVAAQVSALVDLAALYRRLDQDAEAETRLNSALELEPGAESALDALVALYRATGRAEEAIGSMITLAEIELERQNLFAAEERLNAVLEIEQDNREALELLSALHLRSGDTDRAVRELFLLESAAENRGEVDVALELLGRIESVDETNAEALRRRADLLESAGRADEATDVRLRLSDAQIAAGDTEAARTTLLRIVASDPQHAKAHKNLVTLCRSAGDDAGAIDELFRYADALTGTGDTAIAATALNEILELAPGNDRALWDLADLHELAGEIPEAIDRLMALARHAGESGRAQRREEALRRVIALDALNGEAQLQLRELYTESGRADLASELAYDYAARLVANRQTDRAEAVYRDILRMDPSAEQAAEQIIELAIGRGDTVRALEVLRTRADRAQTEGDTDRLVAVLRRCVSIDAYNPDEWERLKDVYTGAGRTAEAIETIFESLETLAEAMSPDEIEGRLLEVLALEDDNRRALRRLGDHYRRQGESARAVDVLMRLGESHAAAGESATARAAFADVLVVDAHNAGALERMADLAALDGDVDEAASAYLRAAGILLQAGDHDGAIRTANALLGLEKHEERALAVLRDAYGAKDDAIAVAEVERRLADLAESTGDLYAAESALRALAQRDAENFQVRGRLADVLARQGKTTEALQELYAVADLAAKSGDAEGQAKTLALAVELDADNAKTHRRLLRLHESAGDAQAARLDIDALIRIHTAQGETDEVEALYLQRMQIDPEDAEARESLSALYVAAGETDKAQLFLFDEAETAEQEGRVDDALALYDRITALDPTNEAAHLRVYELNKTAGNPAAAASALLALVDQCLAARRYHSAEKHLHTILALDPANSGAKERIAELFMRSAQEKASVEGLLRLAEKALGAGQYEEARARLDDVLALDPENPEGRNLVNAIHYRQPTVARREAGSIFEDVEVEYQDQGEVAITWSEDERAARQPIEAMPIAASSTLADRSAEIDLFSEGSATFEIDTGEMGVETTLETPVVDIFATPASAVEETLDGEEGALAAAAEAADFGVDAYAVREDEAQRAPAEPVDLFGAKSSEPEPVELPAEEATEDVDLFGGDDGHGVEPEVDLFGDEKKTSKTPTPEWPAVDLKTGTDFAAQTRAKDEPTFEIVHEGEPDVDAVDLFGEPEAAADASEVDLFAPAEETLEEATTGDEIQEEVLEFEERAPAQEETKGIGALLLDELIGPEKPQPVSIRKIVPVEADLLDDFISNLEVESGGTPSADTGDFLADLASEFRGMLGGEAPQDAPAHFALGIAFREMEQTFDAIAEFEKALALGDPTMEAQIAYQLAQCYIEAENWEQASEYLLQTLDAAERTGGEIDAIDVRMDLGLAYKAMGKLKRALATFQAVDAESANYRGVKAEIQSLRKQLGEGGDDPPDNISFV